MSRPLGRWRPRYLLLSWCGYWLALVLVKLWPAIAAGWQMSQRAGTQGNASVNWGNGILSASITEAGKTMWAGSISILTLSLLVAGPPFLLWLAWLAGSARTNNADESALTSQKTQSELYAAQSNTATVDTSTSKRRTREES